MKCPVVNLRGLSMGLVWLWFMSFNVHVCVPVYLENYCGVSCIGTCWLLGGAWFQCRCGDFWVGSCLLMLSGVKSSQMFTPFLLVWTEQLKNSKEVGIIIIIVLINTNQILLKSSGTSFFGDLVL